MKIGDYIVLEDLDGLAGYFKIIDISGNYIILKHTDGTSGWFLYSNNNEEALITFKKSQLKNIKIITEKEYEKDDEGDKLRFEIGECFNRLSQKEIDNLDELNETIYEKSVDKYGETYAYYESINEFCEKLLDKYKSEEDFIQAIIECTNPDCYGWALHQLKDPIIYKYAKRKMISDLKQDNYDNKDISHYLAEFELPFLDS